MVLRWVVGNWVKKEAARRARDVVSEAIKHQAAAVEKPAADEPGEPARCDVGVVFALSIEAGGLVDLLSGVVATRGAGFVAREGGLDGRRVVMIESGPGRENAARATAALIAGHHPCWVISAGLAGALEARLARGDIVVADSVERADGERLAIDLKMPPEPHLHVGRLLTVDHVVRKPDERRALHEKHQALAVDMETFAVADVCRQEKVRFLSVRAISDTLDEELPADVEHLLNQKSIPGRLGAVAGSIFRRPSSVKDMWKLREDALVGSDRLAAFLANMIRQLAPRETTHEAD